LTTGGRAGADTPDTTNGDPGEGRCADDDDDDGATTKTDWTLTTTLPTQLTISFD